MTGVSTGVITFTGVLIGVLTGVPLSGSRNFSTRRVNFSSSFPFVSRNRGSSRIAALTSARCFAAASCASSFCSFACFATDCSRFTSNTRNLAVFVSSNRSDFNRSGNFLKSSIKKSEPPVPACKPIGESSEAISRETELGSFFTTAGSKTVGATVSTNRCSLARRRLGDSCAYTSCAF